MTVLPRGAVVMPLALIAFALASPLAAQDTAPAGWRERVEEMLGEGRERVALGLLASEIEKTVAEADALLLFSDVAANVGEYDRADAAASRLLRAYPEDPRGRLQAARLAWRRGDLARAIETLAPLLAERPEREDAPKWHFPAVALAGQIEADRGRDAAAEILFDRLVTESQRIVLKDRSDLFALTSALLHFGGKGLKLAEKDLIALQNGGGTDVDVALGRLYLDRFYLHGDAVLEFREALEKRPGYLPALVGLAEAYAGWMKGQEATAALERAAAVNPYHPDVLAARAREDLEGFQLDKAAEKIRRGLALTPGHKRLLGLDAAWSLLSGRTDEFDSKIAAILAIDPTFGEGLRIVAGVLNERRRWPEALELMKRAVAIDGENPAILDDHARYALYLGQNAVAEASLKRADDADGYGRQWRQNIWKLLRRIARRYETVDTERFAVRLDSEDLPALSKIVLPFLERSYAILSRKYGYVPQGIEAERNRMLIEVFRHPEDFSVRTFGFNGLGALGVCFGSFIAMDAPNALPPGSFSWARTFHHELAHTMTLGLSKGRVPRWLTEGLSTFEEAAFDPSWTRGMDRELFDAHHTGDLLRVLEFDPAFVTPRVVYAYYQAGLEAGWLVETHGLDRVIEALRLLGEDLPHEEVFKRAFGTTAAEIDAGFAKLVAARVAPMKMQPRYRPDQRERLEAEWKASPSDDLLVRLGWARLQANKLADAEALLAEAEKRGLSDPRLKLLEARLAQGLGRTDRARELLARLAESGVRDFDLALELGRSAEKAGDPTEAMRLFREAIACFPTNADKAGPRVALARLLRGEGRTADAIALLEEHLRHSPEDLVSRRAVIEAKRVAGEREAALAHLEHYVLVQPLEADIHVMRADLLLATGRFADALIAAECAGRIATQPVPKADAAVLAARALVKLGRVDDARAVLDEALRAVPQHATARELMKELEATRLPEER